MKSKDVEKYEELRSKLVSLKKDIALLSAKKPNEALNEFKLNMINKVLSQTNELIGDFKPEDDFDVFDSVSMPTNSDVLMVLNLYLTGMTRFKEANSVLKPSQNSFCSEFSSKVWDIKD